METLRAIIVDEQPLFRQGIHSTLRQMDDCSLVGEATDAAGILELVRMGNPDVALIGDGLGSTDAPELVQQLRHLAPRLAIIILSPSEDEERLFQCMKAGAAAYYRRTITPEALQETVRKVCQGEYLITADVLVKSQSARRVLPSSRGPVAEEEHTTTKKDPHAPLTGRELEILDYIALGKSNKEIAHALRISDQTVKNHMTTIYKKLAVRDRTEAVVHALRHGWINSHAGFVKSTET
jgi:DNA-binding NarL/FixJ family response regulator